jgi:FtsP/CotA-like multicopper oxidase with cupredoxin domain
MTFDITGTEIAGDFYLGGAERADTVIDFSQFAGQTLILYNDGTAPVPGGDPRYDYYTGNPDQTPFGGAPSTQAGFGPNTRTVMQIVVAPTVKGASSSPPPTDAYEWDKLKNVALPGGALATELPKAYAAVADKHIATAMPIVADIVGNTINVTELNATTGLPVTVNRPLQIKTIHGFTDPNIGRLIAQIGTELPLGPTTGTPLAYIDAPTDIINAGETQYWWIKNNDVDNHPMHFHLFNVQVLAHRIQATGALRPPEPDEMGWKETVKNWPGEDVIVALKPKTPALPFGLPNSVRLLDPTLPFGATANNVLYGAGVPNTTITTTTTDGLTVTTTVPFAFAQLELDPSKSSYGQSKFVSNDFQNFGW